MVDKKNQVSETSKVQSRASQIFSIKNIQNFIESNVVSTIFLTGLGYAIAYIYQLGYLTRVQLPSSLIRIDPTALVSGVGITIFIGFPLLVQAISYYNFEVSYKKRKWPKYVNRTLVIFLISSYVLLALDLFYWRVIALILIAVVLAYFATYITRALRAKSFKKGWALLLWLPKQSKDEFNPLEVIPPRLNIFFVVAVITLFVAFIIGGVSGMPSNNKYVILNSKGDIRQLVVLTKDEDIYVKNYNVKTHRFEDGFIKTTLPINSTIEYMQVDNSAGVIDQFLKQ